MIKIRSLTIHCELNKVSLRSKNSDRGVGDQLLSLEFSENDLFLLHLTCDRGRPVSAQLRVSSKISHPQCKIPPLELSLSGPIIFSNNLFGMGFEAEVAFVQYTRMQKNIKIISKSSPIGIRCKALAEYCQMSTKYQGSNHFSELCYHFILTKLAPNSKRVLTTYSMFHNVAMSVTTKCWMLHRK